jgi:hypothetical protein
MSAGTEAQGAGDRRNGTRAYRQPGLGVALPGRAGKRIVVSFDDDTFGEIRSMAVKRGVSFAEVVRELVEFGLIDTHEAVA